MPRVKRNFVVKTIDGKVGGVQKALKAAGIEVLSVIEVFKEEMPDEAVPEGAEAASAGEPTAGDA